MSAHACFASVFRLAFVLIWDRSGDFPMVYEKEDASSYIERFPFIKWRLGFWDVSSGYYMGAGKISLNCYVSSRWMAGRVGV